MSNQELCTQYELIVTLLEKGDTDEVIKILKGAIERINKGTKPKDETDKDQ